MDLELTAGGRRLRFPAVWLRDNCPCAECQDPGSGQKLKDITDIPNDLAITLTEDAADSVAVTFAPDQHRSVFARSWLAAHALNGCDDSDGRTEDDKELWLAGDLDPPDLPQASWPRYLDRPADRIRALEDVLRRGFVLLHDVPAEPVTPPSFAYFEALLSGLIRTVVPREGRPPQPPDRRACGTAR